MGYPETSKALRFHGTPGSDPRVVEKTVLPLSANELLIQVHAASINPCDIQLWRNGMVAVVAGDKGMGKDYSGTIVSVGKDVKGWAKGDEVFGLLFHIVSNYLPTVPWILLIFSIQFGQGTFSEYISINPASDPVAKKPTALTHEQAASIPLVALTAYACLEWLPSPSTARRRVVIRGASGGTGSWLVQRESELWSGDTPYRSSSAWTDCYSRQSRLRLPCYSDMLWEE